MQCYELDFATQDVIPGFYVSTYPGRPYVTLAGSFGAQRFHLNDKLVRDVTGTGATRIFNCTLDIESRRICPAQPNDDRVLVNFNHTADSCEDDVVEFVERDGARILFSDGDNCRSAIAVLSPGSTLEVIESWTRYVPGTGRDLLHWFRQAQYATRKYHRYSITMGNDGVIAVTKGPEDQMLPTFVQPDDDYSDDMDA